MEGYNALSRTMSNMNFFVPNLTSRTGTQKTARQRARRPLRTPVPTFGAANVHRVERLVVRAQPSQRPALELELPWVPHAALGLFQQRALHRLGSARARRQLAAEGTGGFTRPLFFSCRPKSGSKANKAWRARVQSRYRCALGPCCRPMSSRSHRPRRKVRRRSSVRSIWLTFEIMTAQQPFGSPRNPR